jgi:PQQ-dependent dehydrogenase (methanol/ethanol family)
MLTIPRRLHAGLAVLALFSWKAQAQPPQGPPRPLPEYTAAQAAAGKTAYTQACQSCHGASLDDGEFGPVLRGPSFLQKFGGKPANDAFTYLVTKMPPDRPNGLGTEAYTQIFAYILQQNGVPAGANALTADAEALKKVGLPAGPPAGPAGGLSPGIALPKITKKASPLDKYTSVTDAMLANPAPGEWLTWRRSSDDHGFSPLKQITKANVSNLKLAWTWSLPRGPNQATPLVHDGVMFLYGYGDKVQALNAATGDLLWEYARQLPIDARPSVKKNIAIYGDRIYVGTSDMHLVALDAKSGRVIWDHQLVDVKEGFNLTGGPLVAKNRVMIGTNGRVPGKNFIIALDTESGNEAWRFNTIAQPGEPNGESWNGLPVEKRNGASVWVAGSYDATLNLAFFGIAQTYDTGPLRNLVKQPGVTNDGLYTDSTLAFNPETGKLVWYFQHQPNDQWDLDWVFERVVVKLPAAGGGTKPYVITSGKQAIYDALEADTGKYAFSIDLGLQNIVTAIDPKTGAKTIDLKLVPGDGETKMVCPHAGGAKNWIPESYNAETKMMFVPMAEACMDLIPVAPGGRGSLSTGVRWAIRPRPEGDGNYGQVAAINMQTRKIVWKARQHAPETSGVLATAGGVVFHGALDRSFKAVDDATGKTLWETRLGDVPNNAPISFTANGKQYVAIGVGNGGAWPATYQVLVPDIRNPDPSAGIWVFELPGSPRAK